MAALGCQTSELARQGRGGAFTYFWPMWVIGPWGAVLAFRVLTGFEGKMTR
ncbi:MULTISPECIES: hypothetical protein [Nocardia]|uniref:hypothetical protein n=1 Tax=Nocardia TaxID=1817 RepID=UPI002453A950|nr:MULTISPECIES: hypothetical protein [Nocardia]